MSEFVMIIFFPCSVVDDAGARLKRRLDTAWQLAACTSSMKGASNDK